MITGASAGVGRATAHAFARSGASVGLLARASEGLEETGREVRDMGGRALEVPTDVSDFDAVSKAADAVEEAFGEIDIWINNAMATVFAPFWEVKPEEFARATEVTYLGYVWGTRAALERMRPRDRGTVVQVGSALAYRSIPLQSAYCGAKHAIVGFTDSLRSELLHDGSNVRVTAVHLPAINTPQFQWSRSKLPRHPQPVPPIYQPEVAARAIHWAAHHPRREVRVGLSTLLATEVQKVAPGLADMYLARTGFDAQQTAGAVPSDRPDNLYRSVPGVHATRGPFTGRSRSWSWQSWINRSPRALAAAGIALGILAGALTGRSPAR